MDTFLERIPASNVPTSIPLAQDTDPVGPVAAVGGAVWIPVRDGVLQYDPTGEFVRKVTLPDADQRWVAQVGKRAAVTDGRVLRDLDPSVGLYDSTEFGQPIIGLATGASAARVLLRSERGEAARARVVDALAAKPVRVTAVLPDGFVADGLAASTSRVWATGTVDGSPAIALLADDGVRATVVLEHATPGSALAWTSAHSVRAVSDGKLYDITIP